MIIRKEKTKKKRSKQFTGCWTCRRRGIKCDELKPTCEKCDFSKIECEGYQVRLCWENNSKKSKRPRFDTTRCFLLSPWHEGDLLDDLQVDYYLEKIEIASSFVSDKNDSIDMDAFSYGPFQVFKADGQELQNATTRSPAIQQLRLRIDASLQEHNSIFSESVAIDLLVPDVMNTSLEKLNAMKFSGLDRNLEVELLLVDYWTNSVTRLFVPTMDDKYNPYKMFSNLVFNGGDSYALEVKRLTIHAFCAVSASFLKVPGKSLDLNDSYHTVVFESYWKYHKSRALDLISRLYLSKESFSFEMLCMIIASMLLLLTMDIFHPSDQWQVHLRGLLSVFKTLFSKMSNVNRCPGEGEDVFEILAFFGQMTKISYLFGKLASIDTLPIHGISVVDFDFLKFPNENNKTPLLLKNHGISESMLECLMDIFKYLQFPNNDDKSIIISAISERIIACSPSPMNDKDPNDFDSQIIYHQSNIFYVALKLYFLRELVGEKPTDVQNLVDNGIDHMEKCLELLNGSGSTGLFWPYFVICCEAITIQSHQRIERWFNTTCVHQITTIEYSILIIREVWKKRLSDECLSWIAVKEEMNPTLLLN